MRAGSGAKYDREDTREGVADLLMYFEPLVDVRHVRVTKRKTNVDFAHILKQISDA